MKSIIKIIIVTMLVITGNNLFASVVRYNNISGCQFHPEKSGKDGLKIINNFVKMKD